MKTLAIFLALAMACTCYGVNLFQGNFIGNGSGLTNIPPTGVWSSFSTANPQVIIITTNGDGTTPAGTAGTWVYAYTNPGCGAGIYINTSQSTPNVVANVQSFLPTSSPWVLAPSNDVFDSFGTTVFFYQPGNGASFNPITAPWMDMDHAFTGTFVAQFGTNTTVVDSPTSGRLAYNGYMVRNILYNHFLNNKVTKIMYLGDSYASPPFGGSSFGGNTQMPIMQKLAGDIYDGAWAWASAGAAVSTYWRPPPGNPAGNPYALFPAYFTFSSEPTPSYGVGFQPQFNFVGPTWGSHGGSGNTYGTFSNANNIMVVWCPQPKGGNNLLVQTNGVTMTTLNGLGPVTNSILATNFPVFTANYSVSLTTTTAANSNVYIGAWAWNTTNGVAQFYTASGGTTLYDMENAGTNCQYTNVWNAISPDIVVFLDKHTPSDNPLTARGVIQFVHDMVNSSFTSSAIWCLVGTSEIGNPIASDSGSYINQVYYNMCVQNGWVYNDVHTPGPDFNNLMSQDFTHHNYIGQNWAAAVIEQQWGLQGASEPAEAILNAYEAQFWQYHITNQTTTPTPVPGHWILWDSNQTFFITTPGATTKAFVAP